MANLLRRHVQLKRLLTIAFVTSILVENSVSGIDFPVQSVFCGDFEVALYNDGIYDYDHCGDCSLGCLEGFYQNGSKCSSPDSVFSREYINESCNALQGPSFLRAHQATFARATSNAS